MRRGNERNRVLLDLNRAARRIRDHNPERQDAQDAKDDANNIDDEVALLSTSHTAAPSLVSQAGAYRALITLRTIPHEIERNCGKNCNDQT